MRTQKRFDTLMWGTLLIISLSYIMFHDLLGETLLSHSDWDSYTLQALAWQNGNLALDQNYTWLELAIYEGNYYVSFPPVPTLPLFPLALIFGADTPNNLLVAFYAGITLVLFYKSFLHIGFKREYAMFWAVFAVYGSNALWMSTNGGVWFQAQLLNMLLCALAMHSAFLNRRTLAYISIALAVGCRPFSIAYFLALIVYFYTKDEKPFIKYLLSQIKYFLATALIGIGYMVFNFARFGDLLEFGHNYLPEFLASEHGQFTLGYIPTNLERTLISLISINENLGLDYTAYNGFLMYIANPIFIVSTVYLIRDIIKKRMTPTKVAISATLLLNYLALCAHETFGGWQFGARYTVHMIAFVMMYIPLSHQNENGKPKAWEVLVGIFAVIFNAYGALSMNFVHIY